MSLWHIGAYVALVAILTGLGALGSLWFLGNRTTVAAPTLQPAEAELVARSLFGQHATGAGVRTCAVTYARLGELMTSGTRFAARTETAKADPDRHSVQGIVGMTFSGKDGDYAGPAAGIVFASPAGGSCEGNMVRIVPFAESCAQVQQRLPSGGTALEPLSGIAVHALSGGEQVMLMPANNECVAVTIVRSGGGLR